MSGQAQTRTFLIPPVERLPAWLGTDDRSRAQALAEALATDPSLAACEVVLVVGVGSRPYLAIVGKLDEATEARIEALPAQLDHLLSSVRYVDYRDVERDVEALARALRARLGDLDGYRFTAIPRGGLIVLGMLSYALGLDHSQLRDAEDGRPVVLVDDIALTGARLRRSLLANPKSVAVVAHLYSHPDLRTAIESAEPHVEAVVAAADLQDRAPERLGDHYGDWLAEWQARSPDDYWIGLVDRVCLPWSEPDISVWNPVTAQVEAGWRLLPPHLVMKTRHAGERAAPVQLQEAAHGLIQPTARLIAADLGHEVVLVDTASRASFGLTGAGAAMWRALVDTADLAAAAKRLARDYDAAEADLLHDLRHLVDDLVQRGLLAETVTPD